MEDKFFWIKQEFDSKTKKELDEIKTLIRATIMEFHNYVFPKYITNYKSYLWFVAERMQNISQWQSNINYPMVSSTIDTLFSNIFDFWYEFWIKELWLKNLCTKAFDFRWIGKKVFKEVVKEVLITWKGYVKDFIINEDYKDKFFWKELSVKIKTPSLLYVSCFDVMYDRSKWLENSSYKVIRTFSTGKQIKDRLIPMLYIQSWWDKKSIEKTLDVWLNKYKLAYWNRFSMYDYNPVKSLTATTQWYTFMWKNKEYYQLPIADSMMALNWWYTTDWVNTSEVVKNYYLNDNQSTFEVVEYVTYDKRYIFINWNLFYLWNKLQNLWEIREATYNVIPWTWNAMWAADKQQSLQEIQNTLWNSFIDNVKLNLGPMFQVTGNPAMTKDWVLDFKAFRVLKTQAWNKIEKIQLWIDNYAPTQFMQLVDWASQKDFWLSNYVVWWAWSIERTQWWIDLKFNQYKSKLTPITDSIDQMMWNIARSWILIYLKFFTKEELNNVWVEIEEVYETDSKTWNEKFKTFTINGIDIFEILDESNITFNYNSLDKVTKEAMRDTIIQNLQYLLQYKWNELNMDIVWNMLAWLDFDPTQLFKKPKQEEEQWDEQNVNPYVQWSDYSKNNYNNYNNNSNSNYNKNDYSDDYNDDSEWWWELLSQLKNII